MKIPNSPEIIINKTDESNTLIDDLIEKLCRTSKKHNMRCKITSKVGLGTLH